MSEVSSTASFGRRRHRRLHSAASSLPAAAWLAAAGLAVAVAAAQPASAAQVDAVGAPAPVGFAAVVGKVKQTVVGVRVKVEEEGEAPAVKKHPLRPDSPFGEFFRRFGIPIPDEPVPKIETALGSGFFISADGYIVTNNHVVQHGTSFEVIADDGRIYPAKVIGTDPQTDVALIKVSAPGDFSFVKFADAEPQIGDWVLAVGNPFGLGGTVTAGIVSARGRDIGEGPYEDFIQIDAPVNKGNSGGPTFNVRGEVVGVNTAIYSPSGGSVGVAFDIPADTVKLVIAQLLERGHVTRGWIGVRIQEVTPAIAEAVGLTKPAGALVAQVEPGAPAVQAGIKTGDVILAVNGQEIKDPRELARRIAAITPGTSAKIDVFRDGKNETLTVPIGELKAGAAEPQPPVAKPQSEQTSLGVDVVAAKKLAGAGDQGVVITNVEPHGAGAEAGLEAGDVILDAAGHGVDTPEAFRQIVQQARKDSKAAILLRVRRDGSDSFVAVHLH